MEHVSELKHVNKNLDLCIVFFWCNSTHSLWCF